MFETSQTFSTQNKIVMTLRIIMSRKIKGEDLVCNFGGLSCLSIMSFFLGRFLHFFCENFVQVKNKVMFQVFSALL